MDVEDAAAALLTFANGAYGVLETSRIMHGKRVSMTIEVYGSKGSADWDLERPDEFRVCLPGRSVDVRLSAGAWSTPATPGHRTSSSPAATARAIGWLGFEVAMWAEFLSAIAEGRPAHADFVDGVVANAVIDALYASAASGTRTAVVLPSGVDPANAPDRRGDRGPWLIGR